MSLPRRIDDAVVDAAQTVVARVAARTGAGKEAIMRDVHLTCAVLCGLWAVVSGGLAGPSYMTVPLIVGAVELVDALVHERRSRRERTIDGWKASMERAAAERTDGIVARLFVLAVTILLVGSLLGRLPLMLFSSNPPPHEVSTIMIAPVAWFVATTVAKYLAATQPPAPGAPKEEAPARGATVGTTP